MSSYDPIPSLKKGLFMFRVSPRLAFGALCLASVALVGAGLTASAAQSNFFGATLRPAPTATFIVGTTSGRRSANKTRAFAGESAGALCAPCDRDAHPFDRLRERVGAERACDPACGRGSHAETRTVTQLGF